MSEEPVSYDAEKAGEIIGRSAYWMKTQARAGRIPYTRVGRSYRWLPQHLSEILRDGEQRPKPVLVPRTPTRRRAADAAAALKAKPPRRRRDAA